MPFFDSFGQNVMAARTMAGLGVGPGDEVIIPSSGWYADFERKITSETKAVIVVHFQGGTNDMDRILAIAAQHNIKVVEDCAQACGATYKEKKVGSLGDVSCFSFQQNKIMSTGDGGLLLARDPKVFERAVMFHDLGMVRPALVNQLDGKIGEPQFAGAQFRMNEFTGAVALAQLRKLDHAIVDAIVKVWRGRPKPLFE